MHQTIRILIVLILFFNQISFAAVSINSINNQHTFKYLTIDQGLSNNLVTSFCTDSLGYIWFGTFSGLNKYDGYSITSYFNINGDSTSLINNGIFSMFLDSRGRFWVGTNGGLCQYNYAKNNFIYKPFVIDGREFNPFVGSMCEDKNGNLWIGTNIGLIKMDGQSLKIDYYPLTNYEETGYLVIRKLLFESDSILDIGTDKSGFIRYNILNNIFKTYMHDPDNDNSISGNNIAAFYLVSGGSPNNLWIGTYNSALNIFDPHSETFKRIEIDETNHRSKRVRSIIQDDEGNIWLGTRAGLYMMKYAEEMQFVHYAHSDHSISTLSNNSIYDIYIDKTGGMWVGTYAGGVNYTNIKRKKFEHFRYVPDNNQFLNSKIVQCFATDTDGNLWIGTEDGGLNVFNKNTGLFNYYMFSETQNSISSNNVKCLMFDNNGGLWIGTDVNGIDLLDTRTNRFYHFKNEPDNENSLTDDRISSLLLYSNNDLFIGTKRGLCILNPKTHKIRRLDVLKGFRDDKKYNKNLDYTLDALARDNDGNIYIGVNSYGIFKLHIEDTSFQKMDIYDYVNPLTIFLDSKNNLWMGSNKGLYLIENFENSVYTKYTINNGLPSDLIHGILEDQEHNLWISTSAGLVKFVNAVTNPYSQDFVVYDQSDGLQSKQFADEASFKDNLGNMYFGGINGFNVFHPQDIKECRKIPGTIITGLKIQNEKVFIGQQIEGKVVLPQSIESIDVLKLSHKHYMFTLEFVSTQFTRSDQNKFAYRLEGFDPENSGWNYTSSRINSATYTNLPKGNYVFKVRSCNTDNVWNDTPTTLLINVVPPFYKTTLFKLFLFLSICILLYLLYLLRTHNLHTQKLTLEKKVNKRTKDLSEANVLLEQKQEEILVQNNELMQHRNRLEDLVQERTGNLELAMEKAQESDRLKSAFLANMSHEIRTPLNGIVGFCDLLKEEKAASETIKLYINTILSSSDRLLSIVNDVLDISKIETGQIDVKKEIFSLSIIMEELEAVYAAKVNEKLDFIVENKVSVESDLVYSDKTKIFQVLNNLLSNALKFTQEGSIKLKCEKKNNMIQFSVQDTGIGISEKDKTIIFERFRQAETDLDRKFGGTGLGLAIAQKYTEMLEGTIWVESQIDQGSTFYFTFPQEPFIIGDRESAFIKQVDKKTNQAQKPLLLIVDDEDLNLIYLKQGLAREYDIILARNGHEALEVVKNNDLIDLVLMDIRMPKMNGIDALQEIRKFNSHLPVIAQTAYGMTEDKNKMLELGFTDYISKPIKIATIRKLIKRVL